jgi:membrane protein implicated in regulation of membrane protease activity
MAERTIQRLFGIDAILFVTAAVIGGLAWTFDWPWPVRMGVLILFAIDAVVMVVLARRLLRLRRAMRNSS